MSLVLGDGNAIEGPAKAKAPMKTATDEVRNTIWKDLESGYLMIRWRWVSSGLFRCLCKALIETAAEFPNSYSHIYILETSDFISRNTYR